MTKPRLLFLFLLLESMSSEAVLDLAGVSTDRVVLKVVVKSPDIIHLELSFYQCASYD